MKLSLAKRNLLFFIVVVCVQLALYLFLVNRAERLTPPGHVHTMMQVDTFYPDIIRQSKLGRWAITDDHTTQPSIAIHTHIFFILAGKVAALGNIDPVDMYELLRVTGAMLVFLATYMLITELLPPALHILAIVFTFVIDIGPIPPNIFIMPNLATHFGLPHHLWAEAMGLMLLYVILKASKTPSVATFFVIVFLALLGTVTLPSYFIIITACVFAPWLLYGLATKTAKRTFPPVILAVLAVLAAGLWIKYEFAKSPPPWNVLNAVEKSWWTTREVLIPFIRSYTFFYPFVAALIVLLPAGWSRLTKQIRLSISLTAGWSFLPVALIYLAKAPWFPVANGRIVSDVSRIPIGILSTIGVYMLWQKIRHISFFKTIALSLFILLTMTSLFFSVLYFNQSLEAQNKNVSGEPYSWTLYPTNNLWNGMMALKNVPAFSHVMIGRRIGELITAYLPLRVYQSTPQAYTDWNTRQYLSYQFYRGKMDSNDVRGFLRTYAISYVFFGPEEQYATLTPTLYPEVLDVIYQNPEVIIYKVKNL